MSVAAAAQAEQAEQAEQRREAGRGRRGAGAALVVVDVVGGRAGVLQHRQRVARVEDREVRLQPVERGRAAA